MKKILLILAIIVSAVFAKAQITITLADFGTVGYVGIQNNDINVDTAHIHVGPPGNLSQIWNFDSLHITYMDTIGFVNPTTTPFAANFPAATIAISQSTQPGLYEYLATWTDSIKLLGIGIPANTFTQTTPAEAVRYNPAQMFMKLPATYNSTFGGGTHYVYTIDTDFVVAGHLIDTMQQRYNVRDTSMFDAWGTMITPLGSYPVIRQMYVEHSVDSLYLHNDTLGWQGVSGTKDSSLTFRWYANGENFALVEIPMDPTWTFPAKVIWLGSNLTGIQNIKTNQNGIIVYPNPASDNLNIAKSNDNPEYIFIYNMIGQLVNETLLTDRTTRLSTTAYSNGLYTYRVLDSNKVNTLTTGKFIINN